MLYILGLVEILTDLNGQNVTAVQDTPIASVRDEPHIFFGTDVFVQKPLEFLPQGKQLKCLQ